MIYLHAQVEGVSMYFNRLLRVASLVTKGVGNYKEH